jgi:hypothetical protein
MNRSMRILAIAASAAVLGACAHAPDDHTAHGRAGAGGHDRMAMMDTHMKAMREMHEKMAKARTPEERQALMAEHRKLMHEGMGMMGGMRGMGGTGGMGGPQMMEKRMDMMESMMQMMMDRMEMTPPAAK